MPRMRALTSAQAELVADAFWRNVEKGESCWLWRGRLNSQGYGALDHGTFGNSPVYAHRIAFALTKGSIPADLTVDHLCRTPACVNPDHLELVTAEENRRRAAEAQLVERTACPKGHPYTYSYVHPRTGRRTRMCRECGNERNRKRDPELRRQARRAAYSAARGCSHVAHRGARKVLGQRTDGGWEPCPPRSDALAVEYEPRPARDPKAPAHPLEDALARLDRAGADA